MITIPKYKLLKLETENEIGEEVQEYVDSIILPTLKSAVKNGIGYIGLDLQYQQYVSRYLKKAGWNLFRDDGRWCITRMTINQHWLWIPWLTMVAGIMSLVVQFVHTDNFFIDALSGILAMSIVIVNSIIVGIIAELW